MKKKQTTTKRQTWTPAKRAAFAAKMKAAREAAAATKKPNTTTRKNPPSVNGEGMTFAEWKAAAGPKAPKGLEAVKAWKAGEDPTEYRAPTKATRNPPMLPFHVYAEDGFESSHKTEAAAKRAADRGARRRRMAYSVIRVSASGYTGGGHGSEVYATDAKPKGTTKNAPRRRAAAKKNPPGDRIRKLAMEWDDQDRSNPGWAWFATYESGHRLSGGLDGRRSASLATMRRRFAREFGRDFPAAARHDGAWRLDGSQAWVWD